MTADDEQIAAIIKESGSETVRRLTVDMSTMSLFELADVFKGVRDYAESQLLRLSLFTPSVCTEPAVGFFKDGMGKVKQTAELFLDWMASGAVGDPGTSDVARESGELIAQAIGSLAASC